MKAFAEFHSHSNYSGDGKASMEKMVIEAINLGYTKYGISDHGYQNIAYGVKYTDYPKMRAEMDELKDKYKDSGIQLLLGVEANILDDQGNIDVDDQILQYVDYVLAGYHFASKPPDMRGLKNHIRNYTKVFKAKEQDYNTRALINAMKNNNIFILTHPGDKGDIYTRDVAKAAIETNTILEINGHHDNLSVKQLLEIKNMDVKFSVGSDAHKPEHLKYITKAIDRAQMAGISSEKIINVKTQ